MAQRFFIHPIYTSELYAVMDDITHRPYLQNQTREKAVSVAASANKAHNPVLVVNGALVQALDIIKALSDYYDQDEYRRLPFQCMPTEVVRRLAANLTPREDYEKAVRRCADMTFGRQHPGLDRLE